MVKLGMDHTMCALYYSIQFFILLLPPLTKLSFPAGKTSKRTPVRLRHKIEKASAAKQRKLRKLAKKVSLVSESCWCLRICCDCYR